MELNGSLVVNGIEVDRKRSPVWKHFVILCGIETTENNRRAMCIHCKNASYPAASCHGTSNMKNHLKKCKPYLAYDAKLKGEGTIFDQHTYRDLIARAIIKHGYAFSWVEHEGNRVIHSYLNNQVSHICRNTAKADCLKLHLLLKADLMKVLSNVPSRICLTSDMWSSCQTDGYLCLTAHFVGADWKLTSRVLNFIIVESPHTGQAMYSTVVKLLQEWGIEKKIFSITLDNASSNDKMQNHMKRWMLDRGLLLGGGNFFHIRCASHVLNLVVKDGLKDIGPIVYKIRESVKYVKWSQGRKETFRECVDLAGITERKGLWFDVPTRWNSTYFMLDRALLFRNAFKELSIKDPLYKHFPESNEWDIIGKIRDILEPFYDITMLFSGSDYPTANLYFENVWKIAMLLKELCVCDDETLKKMAVEMKSKFDKYWLNSDEDDYTTLFAFALVLDPRYKLFVLLYFYRKLYGDEVKARKKVEDVKFKLSLLLTEYLPSMRDNYDEAASSSSVDAATATPSNRAPTSMSRKRTFSFMEDLDNENTESDTFRKTKLDLYLEEARLDRSAKLDVLQYWKDKENKFGELAHLARDILSVPLTTVASESTFSIGGRILNKWRSSYLPENVGILITACSWLHGYEMTEEEYSGCYVDWSGIAS